MVLGVGADGFNGLVWWVAVWVGGVGGNGGCSGFNVRGGRGPSGWGRAMDLKNPGRGPERWCGCAGVLAWRGAAPTSHT